jgi:hypothetical protein
LRDARAGAATVSSHIAAVASLSESPSQWRDRLIFPTALIVVTGVALALRLWELGGKSIWLDEAWSWRAARLPLADMVDWTAQDRHPPLYYALLHFSVDLFGDSEGGLRSLSVISATGAVAVLMATAWRAGGPLLGLLAGGLLAVHPTHIEFAQEARMYPLVGLFAVLASAALAAAIARPRPQRFILYALLATATIYTHYSGFFVLGVHAALIVSYGVRQRVSEREWSVAGGGLAALVVAGLAYVPWYGHLFESAREGVGHLPEPSWELADVVFSTLLGTQEASDLWLALALPLVCLGLFGVVRRRDNPFVVCVAALAVVPCLQLLYSAARTPVLDVRQTSPYIAGFTMMLGLGIVEGAELIAQASLRPRVRAVIAACAGTALAMLMFAGVTDWYSRGAREDWRAAADAVRGGGTVLIWRGYIDEPLRFYGVRNMQPSPPGSTVAEAQAAAWLVLSHQSPEEGRAILRKLSGQYAVGEPLSLRGIVVYPLSPRTAVARE